MEQQFQSGSNREAGWPWRLLLLSGIVFLTVTAIFAGIKFGLTPYLDSQNRAKDAALEKLGSIISEDQVSDFSNFYSQIINIQDLLKNHSKGSEFVKFLESNTSKDVYFKSMSLDLKDYTAKLDGSASSYEALAQQLEIFKRASNINQVSLDGANLSEEKGGGVNFSIRLNLK